MKKIEYSDKLNWGSVLFDLGIITAIIILKNYWLIILLFFSGSYKIPKWEYKDE